MILTEENGSISRKASVITTLSAINLTWIGVESNLILRPERSSITA